MLKDRWFRDAVISVSVVAVAVAVGILVTALLIFLNGNSTADAMAAMFDGTFGSWRSLATTAARIPPLVLVALGWIVAFRASKVNLGLQGQLIVGGVIAVFIAVELPGESRTVVLLLASTGAALGGGLYAAIAAVLWAKRGVNEVVSTLMLSFVAVLVLQWLLRGPLKDPASSSYQSKRVPSDIKWPVLVEGTPLTASIFVALAGVLVVSFVLNRTVFGFRLRLTGQNVDCARHAGIKTVHVAVVGFVLSGAFAGLAGAGVILGGETSAMTVGFGGSLGFTGIAVAIVARNSPAACVPAALIFAALSTGGGLMQSRAGVPSEIVTITQAFVVILVASSEPIVRSLQARKTSTDGVRPSAHGHGQGRAGSIMVGVSAKSNDDGKREPDGAI